MFLPVKTILNVFTYATASILTFFLLSACNSSTKGKLNGKEQLDGLQVPAGYTIEKIVDSKLISFPMFATFDGAGRLFVFESDGSTPGAEDMLKKPSYHVRLLAMHI